jgi:hypothetical protein
MNEARPYIMLLAGSALICVAWIRLIDATAHERTFTKSDIGMYACGCLLILAATILGALWIASSAAAILLYSRRRILDLLRVALANWVLVLPCVLLSSIIVFIAVHSFLSGARASGVGGFSLASFGYSMLELEGVAGWGPGRDDLRAGLGGVSRGELVAMLAFGVVGVGVALSAVRRLDRRVVVAAAITCVAPALFLLGASYLLQWRVVGRHLMPLLLPISLAYASEMAGLSAVLTFRRLAASAIVIGLVGSAGMIRFSQRHYKDDYADAADCVRPFLDRSKLVLWAADDYGAAYYHLLPVNAAERWDGSIPIKAGSSGEMIFGLPSDYRSKPDWRGPEVIALSKPDIYDAAGRIRRYIQSHEMRRVGSFPAFAIYER